MVGSAGRSPLLPPPALSAILTTGMRTPYYSNYWILQRPIGCTERRDKKIAKQDEPLLTALRQHWGAVEFVCIPVGHAGTTLLSTIYKTSISSALTRVRPCSL